MHRHLFNNLTITTVLLLTILTPQLLWSQVSNKEAEFSLRAQQIMAEAPKTPEELLRVIKDFMDHPNMDGYDFGEKISGIDRANWGPANTEFAEFKSYTPLGAHSPYFLQSKESPPPQPLIALVTLKLPGETCCST